MGSLLNTFSFYNTYYLHPCIIMKDRNGYQPFVKSNYICCLRIFKERSVPATN
jgi:hypothetical protein